VIYWFVEHLERLARRHDVISGNYNMKFHEIKNFIPAETATRYIKWLGLWLQIQLLSQAKIRLFIHLLFVLSITYIELN